MLQTRVGDTRTDIRAKHLTRKGLGAVAVFLSQLAKGSGLCSAVPKSYYIVSSGRSPKGCPLLPSSRLAMLTLQNMVVGSSLLQRNLPVYPVRWGQRTELERGLALSWIPQCCGSSGWRLALSARVHITSPTNGFPESKL